jgi:hypothetical protein
VHPIIITTTTTTTTTTKGLTRMVKQVVGETRQANTCREYRGNTLRPEYRKFMYLDYQRAVKSN